MRKIALLILVIILASCHSQYLQIKVDTNKIQLRDTVDYIGYWTKVLYGMPEKINFDSLQEDYKSFANAVLFLKHGRFDSSEQRLLRLFKSPNDTLRNYANTYLSELYHYQRKFTPWIDAYLDTIIARKYDTLTHPVFIQRRQNPERYIFGKIADTLPLVLNSGLASVILKVNGEELKFLLDTGCDISAITKNSAGYFKHTKMNYPVSILSIVGKTVPAEPMIIDSFTIGSTVVQNMYATLFENSDLKFRFLFITFLKFDGIVGWNVLKNLDFEIDYKNKWVIIRKPELRQTQERNLIWILKPLVKLTNYMGAVLYFNLDIGAMNTSLYDLIYDKMEIPGIVNKKKWYWGVGGAKRVKAQRIPSLTLRLDQYLLDFKNIRATDKEYYVFRTDGNLGADVGAKGRVRIDALNGRYDIFPEFDDEK